MKKENKNEKNNIENMKPRSAWMFSRERSIR